MKITLVDRLKATFAPNPEEYWWAFFSDAERDLGRKSVWDLAGVIENGDSHQRIVADYMLKVRLARIQSKATWGAAIIGFLGTVLSAALGAALGATLPIMILLG